MDGCLNIINICLKMKTCCLVLPVAHSTFSFMRLASVTREWTDPWSANTVFSAATGLSFFGWFFTWHNLQKAHFYTLFFDSKVIMHMGSGRGSYLLYVRKFILNAFMSMRHIAMISTRHILKLWLHLALRTANLPPTVNCEICPFVPTICGQTSWLLK